MGMDVIFALSVVILFFIIWSLIKGVFLRGTIMTFKQYGGLMLFALMISIAVASQIFK